MWKKIFFRSREKISEESGRDPEKLRRELLHLQSFKNFILECMHAVDDPVNILFVLFEDEHFTHEQLVEMLMQAGEREPDDEDTYFSRSELQIILDKVNDHIDHISKLNISL